MIKEFLNKRIAIIGCVQGLGRSIAMGCSSAGAELFLFDVNPEIEGLVAEIQDAGGKARCRVVDVSNLSDSNKLFKNMFRENGLDGLIYTPRSREPKDFMDYKLGNWDTDLNITLKGAFFAAQEAIPYLARNKEQYPFIIYISSILSQFIGPESVGYHVAKAGLDNLTRYLAVRVGHIGIRVNAVQLGWFIKDSDKEFYKEENKVYRDSAEGTNPLKRVGTSEDLLNAILFLGSHKARFITGQIMCIDGGVTILDPGHTFNLLKAQGKI
ncbi:MAG: SDR family oxidoreductase [Candidatus Scalindua sp.]|jgi:NAD(P)-dependent dehydrogenase (short-subunit alcohol dehydrogenase family)|nr:SDR family oxidoreductase [Candidatus Scalindua sp.]